MNATLCKNLQDNGYALLRGAISERQCEQVLRTWESMCAETESDAILRTAEGVIYGARNLLQLWPSVVELLEQPELTRILRDVLGADIGVVRVLYFDKPPQQSWALPWHKDLSIAVREHRASSVHFTHPTTKYGVPHFEASETLLQQMLNVRVHLDDVTNDNGPLKVIPGSQRTGKRLESTDAMVDTITCQRGDLLLIRPLVAHASGHSAAGTHRHRRILHFELSGQRALPDGYDWYAFVPLNQGS